MLNSLVFAVCKAWMECNSEKIESIWLGWKQNMDMWLLVWAVNSLLIYRVIFLINIPKHGEGNPGNLIKESMDTCMIYKGAEWQKIEVYLLRLWTH